MTLVWGVPIVRGGAVETLEGDWHPQRLVILEFPDVERAKAWLNSDEYRQARALRHATATSQMIVVPGVDHRPHRVDDGSHI